MTIELSWSIIEKEIELVQQEYLDQGETYEQLAGSVSKLRVLFETCVGVPSKTLTESQYRKTLKGKYQFECFEEKYNSRSHLDFVSADLWGYWRQEPLEQREHRDRSNRYEKKYMK